MTQGMSPPCGRVHQHGGVEDAVLLGVDQLLAVQQQERPVGPVRGLEEWDAGGQSSLPDETRALARATTRTPIGVVPVTVRRECPHSLPRRLGETRSNETE